jgi:hypothetical protein
MTSWLWGWVWQKTKLLILNKLLALGVALGATDSKGLVGFGKLHRFNNPLIIKHFQNLVALESKFPILLFSGF